MEIIIFIFVVLGLAGLILYLPIRAGLALDRKRRAENNQDLADRINAQR